jgi:N utilization substance protein A
MKQQDQENRTHGVASAEKRGLGPGSAGQSGDTQGLPEDAEAGPESVEELVEEGQAYEAEAIGGVEDAPEPDVAEVRTTQVPEDDVPVEYLERD